MACCGLLSYHQSSGSPFLTSPTNLCHQLRYSGGMCRSSSGMCLIELPRWAPEGHGDTEYANFSLHEVRGCTRADVLKQRHAAMTVTPKWDQEVEVPEVPLPRSMSGAPMAPPSHSSLQSLESVESVIAEAGWS
jgi:hypothetical protein